MGNSKSKEEEDFQKYNFDEHNRKMASIVGQYTHTNNI